MSDTPGAGPAGAGPPPNSDPPDQDPGQAPPPPQGWSANQPPPAWAAPSGPAGAPTTGSGWTGPGPASGSASGWGSPGGPAGSGQPDGWSQPGGPPAGPAPAWAWSQQYAQQVKPGIIPLRPLGIAELLDGAVAAIRANPAITLFMGAAVAVVTQTVVLLASYWLLSNAEPVIAEASGGEITVQAEGVAALIVIVVTSWLAGLLATGLLTIVVGRQVVGRSITLKEAWSATWPRLGKLILLSVLQGLIIAAVVVVLFLPAIGFGITDATGLTTLFAVLGGIAAAVAVFFLAWVALSVATPAFMLEKQPVLKAIGRSWRLVRGSRWRVFFVNLLAFIITFVIANIVAAPFQLFGGGWESLVDPAAAAEPSLLELVVISLGAVLGSMITLPFSAAITVLLYVDLRIRREGMDIELARAAGVTLPGAPPPSATQSSPAHPGPPPSG